VKYEKKYDGLSSAEENFTICDHFSDMDLKKINQKQNNPNRTPRRVENE